MAIAVSAIATAIEVGTVAAALSAVATTGMVLSGVGMLTKSKELTKIGAVMGLVGGVGGMINGAMTAGAAGAASAAGAAESGAAAAGSDLVTGAADALQGTAAGGSSGILGAAQSAGGAGFDLTSANFGVNNSLMAGASQTLPTTAATDFAGSVAANTPALGATAGQTVDDYVAQLGPQGLTAPAGPGGSAMDTMKQKFGAAWDSFSPVTKAELLKSAMAIPGAIQAQKNNERALDMQQQRINQTSHGSEVPTFGIIQRAQKGGV